MAGIRDDSAGDYGQWLNPQDQSWLDYLGMKAADVGGGAYNALANITGGLSPIGTSEQGNMALQVPPMINGLMDAGKTIADRGGVGFSGVEEIDAPLKKAWADVLLTGYGGNALAGLSKPRGALGAGAMREAEAQPIRAYRGARKVEGEPSPDVGTYWATSNPEVSSNFAMMDEWPRETVPNVSPVDINFSNPLVIDSPSPYDWGSVPYNGSTHWTNTVAEMAKAKGHDGVVFNNIIEGTGDIPATTYAALQRDTVKSPLTGETLFSDNKPSLLGAALATAGEQQPIRAYRGATNAGNIARDDASILWGSSSPEVASTYARPHFTNYDIEGAVAPLDMDFRNPLTVDANGKHWAELEHGGQRYTADDLANLAKSQGHDGLIVKNVMDTKSWYPGEPRTMPADTYVALQRGTVKSPLTGETLFSRGVPLPPQQDDNLPPWLKF